MDSVWDNPLRRLVVIDNLSHHLNQFTGDIRLFAAAILGSS